MLHLCAFRKKPMFNVHVCISYKPLQNNFSISFSVGSLLIAAASFGGYVFGTDIDFMMLHAKTKPTRKQDRVIP